MTSKAEPSYSTRNYGAGDPNCPICHGLGYVRYDVPEDHNYFGRAFDCECRVDSVENERLNYLRRLGGLEHLDNRTFDSFDTDYPDLNSSQRANLVSIKDLAQSYAENPDGWLVLRGSYGTGKTHLAAAIANYRIAAGEKALFVTTPDLLDYLRSSYGPQVSDQESTYDSRFEELRNAPLLILDDIGVENATTWAIEKLYQIVNHRYNARLATVFTTNNEVAELEARLRSRLADPALSTTVDIMAPDFRRMHNAAISDSNLNSLGTYVYMTFDTFHERRDLPREQADNLARAVHQAQTYAADPRNWLILIGGYSTGKTHLAAAIANYQVTQGRAVLFVSVADLLDHLRTSYTPESRTTFNKAFQELKNAPLLVIDDLDKDIASSGWAREKLYQLFDYRFAGRLPTVITSPNRLEELDKSLPRLVKRFRNKDHATVFALEVTEYLGK